MGGGVQKMALFAFENLEVHTLYMLHFRQYTQWYFWYDNFQNI